MAEIEAIATDLVARFSRIVRRDGGRIRLIDARENFIRIGYLPGTDLNCKEGVCIMPEAELQSMMEEVLAVQAPDLRLQVMRDAD